MKISATLLAVLLLIILGAVSCGIPQEDYDALLAEKNGLQSDYNSLTAEKDVVITDLADARAELTDTQTALAEVQSTVQQLETDLSTARTDVTDLENQIEDMTAEKSELQQQVELLNSEVKAKDLRNFINGTELETWRESVGIIQVGTTYWESVMELQRIAFEDGFILSIDLDDQGDYWGLSLNAFAGNRVYAVYPEALEVFYFVDWN